MLIQFLTLCTSRGAKRGQLTGHDYRVLQERGVSVEEIQQSNDMYLLKKMRENHNNSIHGCLPMAVGCYNT